MASLKKCLKTILGFLVYYLLPRKRFVLLLSSVRSGSTLLKALISEAPEIEHINEERFNYTGNKFFAYYSLSRLAKGSIVLLKKPSELNMKLQQFKYYPELPAVDFKGIVLYRRPEEVYVSAIKMLKRREISLNLEDFIDYWCTTYENLLSLKDDKRFTFVAYDQVTADPIAATANIFSFIGSERKEGVESYSKPNTGEWAWGKGDGSDLIKGESVKSLNRDFSDHQAEVDQLVANQRVSSLMRKYNELLN